jgi:hypothetical protein
VKDTFLNDIDAPLICEELSVVTPFGSRGYQTCPRVREDTNDINKISLFAMAQDNDCALNDQLVIRVECNKRT